MRMEQTNLKIWVERLGAADLFYLFWQGLFTKAKVYYDENNVSKTAKQALGYLRRFNMAANFSRACLSLEKKDEYGSALTYRLQDDLDSCLELFCQRHIPAQREPFKRALKSYLSSYLLAKVAFVMMIEYDSKFTRADRQKNILYLSRGPFNSIVTDFYKQKGYSFQDSFLSWPFLKYCLRPLYLFFIILIRKINFKKFRLPIKLAASRPFLAKFQWLGKFYTFLYHKEVNASLIGNKPAVWIEYAYKHKDFFDFAFWHDKVNKNDFDIVYYLDRDDDPPLAVISGQIEKRGFQWVDLHFPALIRLANLKLIDTRDLAVALFSLYRTYPWWFRVFKFEYKLWFSLYRSVFKKFKTKVIIQHQEVSWLQQAQVDAIEAEGGIMIGFHWSSFPYAEEPFLINPQHVYFVWGQMKFEWLKKKGNTCRYILPCGVWFPKDIPSDDNLGDFVKKYKFIMAIFDTTAVYNICYSPESLNIFYETVLKLLEENRDWGGIIKSKRWNIDHISSLPGGKEIIARINSLIVDERLIFLQHVVSPGLAFSHASLSVCYGLNSVGVIAGVYGYRAVHWDCAGWLRHPFYKEKGQKIAFLELDEFKEAIIKAACGDEEIGDFSKWRKKFNYFQDFSASARVGNFIQYFLEKTKNNDSSGALASAVKQYIAENKVEDSFFTDSRQWDALRKGE